MDDLEITSTHDNKRDAIVAALDELEEGGTLIVHADDCPRAIGPCACTPEIWTY